MRNKKKHIIIFSTLKDKNQNVNIFYTCFLFIENVHA